MPINRENNDKPDLSIIIISYNTKTITKQCLESIFQSKINYEIVIVDNASSDSSVAMLNDFAQKHPNITVIENKDNVGFAKANNQAVKIAKGRYLLFLNSDILVLDRAIDNLFNFYKQNEDRVHFLGGKLLNKDLSPQPSCGPFYTLPVIFGALFIKGDYWGLTRYSPDKTREVDWVSGACILTKKDYFQKTGGFDENIFMYMDEIDLLYRAKKSSYKVFFYPEASFIHLGSASSNGKTYPILQVYKGFLYFYRKHKNDKMSIFFLKFMLKLKSLIALSLGKITGNNYLIKTYEQAYHLVEMA